MKNKHLENDRLKQRLLSQLVQELNSRLGFHKIEYYDTEDVFRFFQKTKVHAMLDIGCSDCRRTFSFRGLASTLVGVDLQKQLLMKAKAQFPELSVVIGSTYYLPFRDDSFDAVTAFHVIEHFDFPLSFLNEIHRILREDGFVTLLTPNSNRLTFIVYRTLTRRKTYIHSGHVFEYNGGNLKELFNKSKFKQRSIFPIFGKFSLSLLGRACNFRLRVWTGVCDGWMVWAKKS